MTDDEPNRKAEIRRGIFMAWAGRLNQSAGFTVLSLTLAFTLTGCRADPVQPNVHATDAESRIAGLVAAAESQDPDDRRALADALNDDDAAVRLFAAETLRRQTGQDFGYHAYDPPAARTHPAQQWHHYLTPPPPPEVPPEVLPQVTPASPDGSSISPQASPVPPQAAPTPPPSDS